MAIVDDLVGESRSTFTRRKLIQSSTLAYRLILPKTTWRSALLLNWCAVIFHFKTRATIIQCTPSWEGSEEKNARALSWTQEDLFKLCCTLVRVLWFNWRHLKLARARRRVGEKNWKCNRCRYRIVAFLIDQTRSTPSKRGVAPRSV